LTSRITTTSCSSRVRCNGALLLHDVEAGLRRCNRLVNAQQHGDGSKNACGMTGDANPIKHWAYQ
jgi:hypothetical protein